MKTTPIIAPLAVALIAAGTIAASATGAFAATPNPADTTSPSSTSTAQPHHGHLGDDATLQQIQAAGASATAKRVTKLQSAIAKVTADTTLTASDRSALLTTLRADLAGMQHQQAALAADTSTTQARTDYATVFRQYRVVAVALPQERIVREADRGTSKTLPRLQAVEQKLADRLGKHQSKDTDAAKSALTDLQQQINTVGSDSQGLAAAALAVTPAQFDQAHTAMTTVRTKAKALRSADTAARKDVHTIRQALHG